MWLVINANKIVGRKMFSEMTVIKAIRHHQYHEVHFFCLDAEGPADGGSRSRGVDGPAPGLCWEN